MKTVIVLLASLLLVASATAQSQDDALKEASQLSLQVVKLHNEGKYEEALPMAKRAVEIRESLLGKEDPLVADALSNLGAVMMAMKNYGGAQSQYEKALSIYEKAYGETSLKVCGALDNLGWLNYAANNNSKAENLFQRSLVIKEKLLGPDHAEVAQAVEILARFYQRTGKYDKSISLYKRIVAMWEKLPGNNQIKAADALEQCACVMRLNRQEMEANKLDMQSSGIRFRAGVRPDGVNIPFPANVRNAVRTETPVYPTAAKSARITGAIVIEVIIDATGKVTDAKVKCGADIFAQAALEAARKWRFEPLKSPGAPAKTMTSITFNFTP